MSLSKPTLTYKAYAYKNGNYPIELIDEEIKLSKTSTGSFIAPKGTVLVKIEYAALNPFDQKLYHLKPAFLKYINSKQGFGKDYSGQVISIGDETKTNVKVGDQVQGIYGPMAGKGTLAEYLLIDLSNSAVGTKPSNIDLAQAASFPVVLGSAFSLLKDLKLEGAKIGILGGNTSVGKYVIQIAKKRGVKEIVTTNSKRNEDLLTKLGATTQIDYSKNPKFVVNQFLNSVQKTGEFDYIIDTYGGDQLFSDINHILKKGGVYNTSVGNTGGSGWNLFFGILTTFKKVIASNLGLLNYEYNFKEVDQTGKWMDEAKKLIEKNEVEIFIDSVYPFDQLNQAIKKLDSGKYNGKIVVKVQQ
ncbi:YIM1 [Candida pseudojiufengensis]|uniref:YIM1 n=1 Tax=Candida pseudojiufengensis TaxID=497109 RepID=UPI002225861F|nr:YIM1 [Candida pseudojiufengensis]KAI5964788.1 YIM1 [Candida pseudojiufengensis]